jgi:hypothetical protein
MINTVKELMRISNFFYIAINGMDFRHIYYRVHKSGIR